MQSAPNALRVVSLCSYLTGDLKPRSIDWPAIKMVKALKGDPINGYFELSIPAAFNPVAIAPEPGMVPPPSPESAGVIEIEFATGGRMRITGPVDASTGSALIKTLAKSKRRR